MPRVLDKQERVRLWALLRKTKWRRTSEPDKAEALAEVKRCLGITEVGTFAEVYKKAKEILRKAANQQRTARYLAVLEERNITPGTAVVIHNRPGVIDKVWPNTGKVTLKFNDDQKPKTVICGPDAFYRLDEMVVRTVYVPAELDRKLRKRAEAVMQPCVEQLMVYMLANDVGEMK